MVDAINARHIPDTKIVIEAPFPTPPPVICPIPSAITPDNAYAMIYPSCEMNPINPHALP